MREQLADSHDSAMTVDHAAQQLIGPERRSRKGEAVDEVLF
jgi:hypothetical protein